MGDDKFIERLPGDTIEEAVIRAVGQEEAETNFHYVAGDENEDACSVLLKKENETHRSFSSRADVLMAEKRPEIDIPFTALETDILTVLKSIEVRLDRLIEKVAPAQTITIDKEAQKRRLSDLLDDHFKEVIKRGSEEVDDHAKHIALYQKIREEQFKPKEKEMATPEPATSPVKESRASLVARHDSSEDNLKRLMKQVEYLQQMVDSLFHQTGLKEPKISQQVSGHDVVYKPPA